MTKSMRTQVYYSYVLLFEIEIQTLNFFSDIRFIGIDKTGSTCSSDLITLNWMRLIRLVIGIYCLVRNDFSIANKNYADFRIWNWE